MSASLDLDRRRLLHAAGAGLTAAALPLAAPAAAAIPPRQLAGPIRAVPLAADTLRVAAVQSHAGADLAANLAAMGRAVAAAHRAGPKHLVAFHAHALQGPWPRDLAGARSVALELAGPEVGALADLARAYGVHLAFAALTRDADWPGCVIPRHVLLGPDGRIVLAPWRMTADADRPFLTTVAAALEAYVARYGAEAVLPVTRTAAGTLAFAAEHAAPEVYRALALKGAEIVVCLADRAPAAWDARAAAAYHGLYVLAPAPAAAPHGAAAAADDTVARGGGSLIVGPRGELLAAAGAPWTQTLAAAVPLAHHRHVRAPLGAHAGLIAAARAAGQDGAPPGKGLV